MSKDFIEYKGYRIRIVQDSDAESPRTSYYNAGILTASNDKILPGFTSIVPTRKTLDREYKKVRIEIPAWIKGISKREKIPYVSFILGDSPTLALSDSSDKEYCTVNAQFLKDFAGQEVDVYIKGPRSAIVVMPSNESIDTSPWFSMVMPVNARVGGIDYIDSTNDASEK